MNIQTNAFDAPILDCPPVDPCRRAAKSLSLAAKLTPSQIAWARSHDWFDSDVDGALIVVDRYTYKGQSFEDRVIWAGTFGELRNWAGY
jgi:hypothetical protein